MHRPSSSRWWRSRSPPAPTSPTAPARSPETARRDVLPNGEGDFHRYVAIGTSVSQGWRSDGVNAASQLTSWPAQLAGLANRELSLPLIAAPGCGAPLIAPLGSGRREGGELAATPFLSRTCSLKQPGVTLPTGNVAISGARTVHALNATPEAPDPSYAPLYARILPPGMSQVSAMEAQNPKVVSVELGPSRETQARDDRPERHAVSVRPVIPSGAPQARSRGIAIVPLESPLASTAPFLDSLRSLGIGMTRLCVVSQYSIRRAFVR